MSRAFLECCLSNNIDISVASLLLYVFVISEPSAAFGMNRLRSCEWNFLSFYFH